MLLIFVIILELEDSFLVGNIKPLYFKTLCDTDEIFRQKLRYNDSQDKAKHLGVAAQNYSCKVTHYFLYKKVKYNLFGGDRFQTKMQLLLQM